MLHQQNRQNDRGPDEATTEGLGPWNRVASGPESSSTESSDLAMGDAVSRVRSSEARSSGKKENPLSSWTSEGLQRYPSSWIVWSCPCVVLCDGCRGGRISAPSINVGDQANPTSPLESSLPIGRKIVSSLSWQTVTHVVASSLFGLVMRSVSGEHGWTIAWRNLGWTPKRKEKRMLHQQNRQNDRGPDEATTEGLRPWNRVASGPESSSTESSDLAMGDAVSRVRSSEARWVWWVWRVAFCLSHAPITGRANHHCSRSGPRQACIVDVV
ncbi:hypothetical protein THAOC_12912 [Thalassiosira oceanica]|uniref:Uncharacterized protein n=1 Tax=Thalassiosira oceanica TaxID=159749 RepID=K0SML3_THAOC|nr:hypothetical protein THAOC_12912 [Thalassiosira oceanica]|eukprot:EJK66184.1 hypothetical protein THAOC_12912 [Thalassiosira oceanica]